MNEHTETTLADYLKVLRRGRLLIAVVAILCAGVAFAASTTQTPRYEATASLTIRDLSQDLTLIGGGFPVVQTPLQLASAHAPQVTRDEVVQSVRRRLRITAPPAAVRGAVAIAIDPNSILVNITAHADKAATAAAIANAFAHADASLSTREARATYAKSARKVQVRLRRLRKPTNNGLNDRDAIQRQTLQSQLARLQSLSTVAVPVEVSDDARVPGSPTSPKPVRNAIAALIFGILLGIAITYARSALDHRLRVASDVERALDATVVGHIRSQALGHSGSAADTAGGKGSPGPLSDPDAESFRILRHNVRYLAAGAGLKTLVVTSAMAQEGKSTVSACLAMTSATAGKRTLLIECDLRRPVLAGRFGLADKPGLSDYLTGHATPAEILQTVAVPQNEAVEGSAQLVCITSGSPPPRPADLLASERFRAFLKEVGEVYETVIIDSAPLLSVADTLEIIPQADGVLVCVRLEQTTRDQARAAHDALKRLPERPTGIVLTDVSDTGEGYYGYYSSPQVESSV